MIHFHPYRFSIARMNSRNSHNKAGNFCFSALLPSTQGALADPKKISISESWQLIFVSIGKGIVLLINST